MYIGAWTEYRLAQEQHSSSLQRRQNAAQPPPAEFGTCPRRSTTTPGSGSRHGAGIYHPSLVDKGGTEVAGLPNRESFRRTLESALSSNLAADDAENISQALEPLLQRLPTIRTPHRQRRRISPATAAAAAAVAVAGAGAGVTLRRSQQRKTTRHRTSLNRQHGCLRFRHTCSDSGTRSARRWSTVDGTLSTRSAFSVASAPVNNAAAGGAAGRPGEHNNRLLYLKRCDGHTIGHRRGVGVTGRGVPQLPLILDTRRRSTSVSRNRSLPPPAVVVGPPCAHRGNTAERVIDGGDPSEGNNGRASRDEEEAQSDDNINAEGIRAGDGAVQTTAGAIQGCLGDAAAASGGYDRGRAASILRAARRRDPARLKADFQQFWTWNKRPSARPGEEDRHCGMEARRTRDFTGTGGDVNISRRTSGRDSGSSPSSSRLEMLARMKAVYMARIDSALNGSPGDTLGIADDAIFPDKLPGDLTNDENGVGFPVGPFQAPPAEAARFRRGETHTTVEPQRDPPPRDRATSVARREATPAPPYTIKLDDTGDDLGRSGSERGASTNENIFDPINSAVPPSVESEHAVVVPDLELTESRIRQVDKYFGGSGGAERRRQRPPAGGQGDDPYCAHAENKEVRGLRDGAFPYAVAKRIVEDRGDTLPEALRGCSSGGGNSGVSDSGASFASFEGAAPIPSDGAAGLRKQALRADAAAREPRTHPPSSSPGVAADRKIDSACAADSTSNRGTAGKAQGRLPPDMSGAYMSEKGCSVWSPTPPASPFARAWCADNSSLEDLVCWTKGLDFEAAVEGF